MEDASVTRRRKRRVNSIPGKEENGTLTFRKALRRGATVKMPRMAVSMGITGLSKNLLQMHVREECLH